jgi:hypothetical protein
MNEGDFIVCNCLNTVVQRKGGEFKTQGLTLGKKYQIYAVIDYSDSLIIINDYGNRYPYSKVSFITLDKHRKEQIDKMSHNEM